MNSGFWLMGCRLAAPEAEEKGVLMEYKMIAALQADPSRKEAAQKKRLLDSCQQFASIFVSYMMKTMREGSTGGEEPGLANGVYQDMFSEQVAKVIGSSKTLGLGSMFCSQLERTMKTHSQPGAASQAPKTVSSQVSLNKVSSNE